LEAKKKKIPQRRCVGCGETRDKKELVRVVRSPEGEISLDLTGKKSGRGAYLCNNLACLKKARKSKRIEQNLETSIPEELYDALENQLGQGTK
jgi:predicted RNA-binding protein YlxR (DUF448 family)